MLLKSSKGGSKFNAELVDPFDDRDSQSLAFSRRESIETPNELGDFDVDKEDHLEAFAEAEQDGQLTEPLRAELDPIDEEDESYLESSQKSEQDISQGAGPKMGNMQLINQNADLQNHVYDLTYQVESLRN